MLSDQQALLTECFWNSGPRVHAQVLREIHGTIENLARVVGLVAHEAADWSLWLAKRTVT